MRALLAFNIFKSLFGREASSGECGSWVFPHIDGGGTGFMGTGELNCPNLISGNFVEAMVSAIFLGVFWYLGSTRETKPNKNNKKISLDIPYHEDHKRPEPHRDFFGR